jgi:toxin-antitoxin system PIN domain toxin
MILLDANLLIYSHVKSFAQHSRAREWLDERLSSGGPVGFPWASVLAFVRIVTNPRVFARPEPVSDAWRQVEAWLDVEGAWIPVPGERHRVVLSALFGSVAMRANLVPDAHLAALAIEHGLLLCSTDGDFSRFPGLRWQNPLQP